MLNAAHLLETAVLLLAAFLAGATVGLLARLAFERLKPAQRQAPAAMAAEAVAPAVAVDQVSATDLIPASTETLAALLKQVAPTLLSDVSRPIEVEGSRPAAGALPMAVPLDADAPVVEANSTQDPVADDGTANAAEETDAPEERPDQALRILLGHIAASEKGPAQAAETPGEAVNVENAAEAEAETGLVDAGGAAELDPEPVATDTAVAATSVEPLVVASIAAPEAGAADQTVPEPAEAILIASAEPAADVVAEAELMQTIEGDDQPEIESAVPTAAAAGQSELARDETAAVQQVATDELEPAPEVPDEGSATFVLVSELDAEGSDDEAPNMALTGVSIEPGEVAAEDKAVPPDAVQAEFVAAAVVEVSEVDADAEQTPEAEAPSEPVLDPTPLAVTDPELAADDGATLDAVGPESPADPAAADILAVSAQSETDDPADEAAPGAAESEVQASDELPAEPIESLLPDAAPVRGTVPTVAAETEALVEPAAEEGLELEAEPEPEPKSEAAPVPELEPTPATEPVNAAPDVSPALTEPESAPESAPTEPVPSSTASDVEPAEQEAPRQETATTLEDASAEDVAERSEPAPATTDVSVPPSEPVTAIEELDEEAAMRAIEGAAPARRAAPVMPRRPVPPPDGVDAGAVDPSAAAIAAARDAVGAARRAVEQVAASRGRQARPTGLEAPRAGRADDLTRIRGVIPIIEKALNNLGIYHFDQIAELGPDEVLWIEGYFAMPGRIGKEGWQQQAATLLADGEERAAE